MGAINSNALSKFVGLLYVAPLATPTVFTRIASVRGLVANIDNTVNQVEINADDTGTVYKGATPEGRFEGSFLENADRDLIALLMGGTPTDTAGTLVTGATQTLLSGSWAVNTFYPITNQNGNGSAITVSSVVGSVDGAFAANDDYDIVIKDGIYGIVFQDLGSSGTSATIAQNVVITYNYTPNATENLAVPFTFREDPRLVAKIVATDGSNTRTIILTDCTFEGTFGLEFLDVVEAGDLAGTTFVLKGTKGSQLTYQNQII